MTVCRCMWPPLLKRPWWVQKKTQHPHLMTIPMTTQTSSTRLARMRSPPTWLLRVCIHPVVKNWLKNNLSKQTSCPLIWSNDWNLTSLMNSTSPMKWSVWARCHAFNWTGGGASGLFHGDCSCFLLTLFCISPCKTSTYQSAPFRCFHQFSNQSRGVNINSHVGDVYSRLKGGPKHVEVIHCATFFLSQDQ